MKIQLVSFPAYNRLSTKERLDRYSAVLDILSNTDADFVMFSEWVLKSPSDLTSMEPALRKFRKKPVTALIELNEKKGLKGNQMYLFQDGVWQNIGCQVFAESSEVDEDNVELLLDEIEKYRLFEVNGLRFLCLQCGENNIMRSVKGEDRAVFRLQKCAKLKRRFDDIFSNVDVVLNPTHTPWLGRFKEPFESRMKTFSEKKRYCFTCTQMKGKQLENARNNPKDNSTMKGMHSRRLMKPIFTNQDKDYLIQFYEID